jgi:serine/threonine-protein kinase RsbT
MDKVVVEIKTESDILSARRETRLIAKNLGFGPADQTRLATAVSELTRNIIQYAGNGDCIIMSESNEDSARIRICVEDHGPGIDEIDQAMNESDEVGAGLPGARRLVHKFEISSRPGHTRIEIEMMIKK